MQDGKLVSRFTITHKDGKPIDPNKRYFVLDISSPDDRELAAMRAFIDACYATGYTQLADDLDRYLNGAEDRPTEGANPIREAVRSIVRDELRSILVMIQKNLTIDITP
jgi:hypothetical protein